MWTNVRSHLSRTQMGTSILLLSAGCTTAYRASFLNANFLAPSVVALTRYSSQTCSSASHQQHYITQCFSGTMQALIQHSLFCLRRNGLIYAAGYPQACCCNRKKCKGAFQQFPRFWLRWPKHFPSRLRALLFSTNDCIMLQPIRFETRFNNK